MKKILLLLALLAASRADALTVKRSWLSLKPPTEVNQGVLKAGYVYVCLEMSKAAPGVVTVEYYKNGKRLGISKPAYPKANPATIRLYMSAGEWTIIIRSPAGVSTRQVWTR